MNLTRFQDTMVAGAKIFFVLSAIVFVFALIWAGLRVSDMNDACDAKGDILVKTIVNEYVCIDKEALK